RVSTGTEWVAEQRPLRARLPSLTRRSLRRAGYRPASKECGRVRRCSYSLLCSSYPLRAIARLPAALLAAASHRAWLNPASCFLQPRNGQQLRQFAAQNFASAKQTCFEGSFRQAQAAGGGRNIHFVEIKKDQGLAVFFRQREYGAADGA